MFRFITFITPMLFVPSVSAASSAVDGTAFFKVLVVLIAIIGVMIGLAFFAKKSNLIGSNHEDLKVVGALPLGQHEKVVVIKVGEEQVLLGVSSGSVRLLKTLDRKIDEKENEVVFSKALSEKISKSIKLRKN